MRVQDMNEGHPLQVFSGTSSTIVSDEALRSNEGTSVLEMVIGVNVAELAGVPAAGSELKY